MPIAALPAASNSSGSPWPPGIYQVTLQDIEEDDRISQFGEGPRVKVTFTVDKVVRLTPRATPAENAESKTKAKQALTDSSTLVAWCNLTMNKRATLRGWIEALLGREIGNGEIVNPNEAIGKSAEATVEAYTGQDGTEKVKLTTLTPLATEDDANF